MIPWNRVRSFLVFWSSLIFIPLAISFFMIEADAASARVSKQLAEIRAHQR